MGSDEHEKGKLRSWIEPKLVFAVDRVSRAPRHGFIPDAFFSKASSEIADTFVLGMYYSSITLCQAVAEGIAKFVARINEIPISQSHLATVNRLNQAGVLSDAATMSFEKIRGNDRNDFHHLNAAIEQDNSILEERAEECVKALYNIESELFEYATTNEGKMIPANPEYWAGADAGSTRIFVR